MVEPCDFSETYTDAQTIDNSYKQIDVVCQQAFYCNRFHIHKVKKLNKFLERLTESNEIIKTELDKIQSAFDTLETQSIIFAHNLTRVQTELLRLSEIQEEEFNKMQITAENNENPVEKNDFNEFNS